MVLDSGKRKHFMTDRIHTGTMSLTDHQTVSK